MATPAPASHFACFPTWFQLLGRKWQTLIEAHVDVKTTDGYLLRLFAIGFTKKRPNQVKKTTYAKAAQIREIRKKVGSLCVGLRDGS